MNRHKVGSYWVPVCILELNENNLVESLQMQWWFRTPGSEYADTRNPIQLRGVMNGLQKLE